MSYHDGDCKAFTEEGGECNCHELRDHCAVCGEIVRFDGEQWDHHGSEQYHEPVPQSQEQSSK